jgi:tetratricopeptide (TPR) repeat protein
LRIFFIRLAVVGTLAVLMVPVQARAQPEAFAMAVRDLAAAAAQSDTAQPAIKAAVARLASALTQWDQAIAALEARTAGELAVATPQQAVRLHAERGLTYRARGRLEDALRELDRAAALAEESATAAGKNPDASDIHLLRALTLRAAGKTEDAARAFHTAWALDAHNAVKAYYALQSHGTTTPAERDRAYGVLVETYRILAAQTAAPSTPPFPMLDPISDLLAPAPVVGDETTGRGFALLAARRYSEAVDALARGGAATKESARTHLARGQAAEAAGHVPEARREYAAALDGTLAGRSVIHVAIGRLAQVDGDLPAAIEALRQAADLNPLDALIRQELAQAYAGQGDDAAAFAELVAALLVDPRRAAVHAAIGQLHLDAGRAEEAIPALTRALELNPDGYEIRYALAMALTRLGRTDEAARQLEAYDRVRRELLERRRQTIEREVQENLATPGSAR